MRPSPGRLARIRAIAYIAAFLETAARGEETVTIDYAAERAFFDRVAGRTVVAPMSRATLERFAHPRQPSLFSKEMMFSLLPATRPLRVLEIGCGEGTVSVQLAYCGAEVTGLDLSPVSIAVARQRAAVQGLDVHFDVVNVVEADSLGDACYDVVWCDLILHHLVEPLDDILASVRQALKPGGRFIAREPVQYCAWLKAVRQYLPPRPEATPDEKPFGPDEFAVVAKHFPGLRRRYFRALARIDVLTPSLPLIAWAARLDNLLFGLPGMKALAGTAVLWADRV
jgi:2-polyprenyl-3-methyl-5-hydroxy-6-metoxy-1,4-benzoquinol methylase